MRSTAYALPAAIFIAQNLLQFYAMARLAPPDFQLWSSFKLLPTGLLHYVVLGQPSPLQWCLCLGQSCCARGPQLARSGLTKLLIQEH